MLCDLNTILKIADSRHYAAAAFNIFGYEDARAVVDAAEALQKPVILMTNKDAVAHMPYAVLSGICTYIAEHAGVPVCLHLDHCGTVEGCLEAMAAGYTSVMFDGSQLPFAENVALTRQVVEAAHAQGVSVEAEIGAVGYSDPSIPFNPKFTEPDQAADFAAQTGVDALAVAVGTVHRMEVQAADLQFGLLERIHQAVPTPLVIHGSTGVTDEDLVKLADYGARKINLGTVLRMEFGRTLRAQFEADPKAFDRIKLFGPCMAAVQKKAEEKLRLLSSHEH